MNKVGERRITAVLCNSVGQFQRWIYERDIRRIGTGAFKDQLGIEYVMVPMQEGYRCKDRVRGLKLEHVVDISFHCSIVQINIEEIREFVNSRLEIR